MKDKMSEATPQPNQPSELDRLSRKLEQAEVAMEKSAMLSDQNEELRRMIDGVPSGLGALRIVDGKPEPRMQINRYFTDRVDIIAPENGFVSLYAFLNCLHPSERGPCRRDFHIFLMNKTPIIRQYRFRSRAGDYVWISIHGTISPLAAGMDIAYFIYTNVDELMRTEQRLKESHALYEDTIDTLQVAMWTYDIAHRRIIMGNNKATRALCQRFGWPRVFEDAPESLLPFIEEQDHAACLAAFADIAAGRDATFDVWYRQKPGIEPYCARETYHTVCDAGRPITAYGISQNVTEEKKVAERYQREIGYLRQTDDNNLVAKGHYNLTQNRVLEYATKDDRIFRVAAGTAYDEAFRAFSALPYHESERREIADKLDRGNLLRRHQQGTLQTSLVYRRARPGDLPIWISMNIHTYTSPETGDLECFTYAYDVSDKMETDEIMGLIASEAFDFIGLIYAADDAFEYVKKSPRVLFPEVRVRTPYSQCLAYVRQNFVDQDELPLYNASVSIAAITAGLRANGGRHAATYHRTEGGQVQYKQMDYVWLDEAAQIVLIVRSDVTASFQRNQQQLARIQAAKLEAERANEAKSAFLSSMSHDLRTPLNGVIGFTSLALDEPDPAKKQAYLEKIDASGRLLLDLVNDTLELSRIESGKIVPHPEAVSPDALVPAVVTALRPSAELKHIDLVEDFPRDRQTPVWCDKLKVQKIVLNLLSNAIKYTPEGGRVTVSLKHLPAAVPDCRYSLVVEDTGIGMSEAFLQRLYEPFAQEKRSESTRIAGTGLGLAIVKRYVDLLGGTISVESALHQGTRFVVSLDIPEVDEGQATQQRTQAAGETIRGRRVLLCEDNVLNTEIAVMLLKNKGVRVDAAENGRRGLERFEASAPGTYDAVLMDIRMPVMDGLEATRAIRALDRSDALTVPVIAMTADAFDESVREAEAAGMAGYVTKPVDPGKLYEVLGRLIGATGPVSPGPDTPQ